MKQKDPNVYFSSYYPFAIVCLKLCTSPIEIKLNFARLSTLYIYIYPPLFVDFIWCVNFCIAIFLSKPATEEVARSSRWLLFLYSKVKQKKIGVSGNSITLVLLASRKMVVSYTLRHLIFICVSPPAPRNIKKLGTIM